MRMQPKIVVVEVQEQIMGPRVFWGGGGGDI
jgi:hypothetical protein